MIFAWNLQPSGYGADAFTKLPWLNLIYRMLIMEVWLLNNNACLHTANATKQLLDSFIWEIINHPIYSFVILSNQIFIFFSPHKLFMDVKRFLNNNEV